MSKRILYVPDNVVVVAKSGIYDPYFYEEVEIQDFPERVYVGDHEFDRITYLRSVKAMANGGEKILAIKFVRAFTNWGLRESKEFVEYLMDCSSV